MIDGLHYFFYDDCIVGASASFRNIVILNENLVILHACVIDYFKIACYNKRKKKRTFDCVKFLFYAIILCCLFCCTFNANAAGLKLNLAFCRPASAVGSAGRYNLYQHQAVYHAPYGDTNPANISKQAANTHFDAYIHHIDQNSRNKHKADILHNKIAHDTQKSVSIPTNYIHPYLATYPQMQ